MTITPSLILIDPETECKSDKTGLPYTHQTWDGDFIDGITELDRDGQLIVRFADGRWTFAQYGCDA